MAEPTKEHVKRKALIVGNWKCNCELSSVKDVVDNLYNKSAFNSSALDVMIAPPLVHIPAVKALLMNPLNVIAQNLSAYPKGSYTGEVNAESLKDFGIDWVIIGQSERRELFQDTEDRILMKIDEAHKQNINVILCIPDKLDEKDFGKSWTVIEKKLNALQGKCHISYREKC